jgi:hypothetical protein
MPTKQFILRGIYSIAAMAVSCTALMATIDFETIPAGLFAALLMAPASILCLLVEGFIPSSGYLKHFVYVGYWGLWFAYCMFLYLTAPEKPELGLALLAVLSVAAFFGYLPLVWSGRFSLSALLIFTTIFAILLGFVVYVVKHV